jgi:hypothetical protein
MTLLAGIVVALLVLFGILALPYSTVLTVIVWLVSASILTLAYVRMRAKLPVVLSVAGVMCVLGILSWSFVLMPWANQPVASAVKTFNPEGKMGRALIVYHPGRSDLQERAITGFVEGLVAKGWYIDLTTASEQTPTPNGYDLLVLGAQSYTWAPAWPVQDYLRRIGDLRGLPTVAILSGLGETGPANTVMRDLINATNGRIMSIYNVWQMRPINTLYGTEDPSEAMRNMAQALQLTR